ncbi:MAG: MerR family transcriptional regulator [Coriobacteriales bacterium]|jgi:DNA-binding transcriptional MerR regulator|nr:MerR family transcriptional regulator [Coriobacteriales bacterium]
MRKSELLSIKQFSELTGIPASTLRYYDKNGIFRPQHKDVNGRRSYQVMQANVAATIKFLASADVPLDLIRLYMARRDDHAASYELLDQQEYAISAQIDKLQQARASVATLKNMIHESDNVSDLDAFTIKRLNERHVAFATVNQPYRPGAYVPAFLKAWRTMEKQGYKGDFPLGGYTRDFADFLSRPWCPDRFFSLNPRGLQLLPAGLYLVGYCRGNYGESEGLRERLEDYVKAEGLSPRGGVYRLYIQNEATCTDPDRYLSKIMIGLQAGEGEK